MTIPQYAGTLSIGPLGRAGRRLRLPGAGREVVVTLPGLFQDGVLIAAPSGVLPPNLDDPLAVLSVECIVEQRLGLSDDPPFWPP